jgi:hypothetical protein
MILYSDGDMPFEIGAEQQSHNPTSVSPRFFQELRSSLLCEDLPLVSAPLSVRVFYYPTAARLVIIMSYPAIIEYSLGIELPIETIEDPVMIAISDCISDILTWPQASHLYFLMHGPMTHR